ncbi:MAG: hypothetical protein ABI895_03325 [Deltaproteobacteria bacterium]
MQAIRSRIPRAAASCASVLLSTALGCHREPGAQSPKNVERIALVAQKCPEIDLGSELIDAKNARVFVEVVELKGPAPPSPSWLDEHAVTMLSSSNLVAFPNVPTSMPWGQCVDAVCSGSQRTLTVTSQLPERGSDPIELVVRIDESAPISGPAAPKVLLATTVRAVSQQPVVLPVTPALSSGSLVVTAYLLRKIDDLYRVLECKARQTEREKQL